VHDRRIDGVTHTFGNAGSLFMNAMSWYDHETGSIWSQPWGRAIQGEYKGVQLNLLPFQLTTWATWRKAHPDTLVMINDVDRLGLGRQGFRTNFVIGLVLGQSAKAYYYEDALEARVINDTLGDIPILLWTSDEIFYAYVREMDGEVLTFRVEGDSLVDDKTNSTWDPIRGLATSGPLQGEGLRAVPSLSSFDWAWRDFYPDSAFYIP
jgi:hypothetical protein